MSALIHETVYPYVFPWLTWTNGNTYVPVSTFTLTPRPDSTIPSAF
jgi:hypothetical protein